MKGRMDRVSVCVAVACLSAIVLFWLPWQMPAAKADDADWLWLKISVLSFVGVVVILVIVAVTQSRKKISQETADGGVPPKTGGTGGDWQKWWGIPVSLLVFVVVWQLLPGLWGWLTGQGIFFSLWVLFGLPTAIVIVSAKKEFAWTLTLAWLAVILFAANYSTFPPVSYLRMTPEEAMAEAQKEKAEKEKKVAAEEQARTVSQTTAVTAHSVTRPRQGEKVVTAPAGKITSEWVTIPKSCQFEWDFVGGKGRYKIVNKLGEEWIHNYPAASRLDLGHGSGIYSEKRYTFAFVSLEERPLQFRVSWWPK